MMRLRRVDSELRVEILGRYEIVDGKKYGGGLRSPKSLLSASRLDPFDSLAVVLDARSKCLLDHCKFREYFFDSIYDAIIVQGTFSSVHTAISIL
jgi:hypothetical protein